MVGSAGQNSEEAGGGDDERLRRYTYLTADYRRTYFAIMRIFSSSLLADLSAADVATMLVAAEQEEQIAPGESSVVRVLERLTQLTKWGNLSPGRRETNARSIAEFAHGSVRYQVDKLALRIHREAEHLLAIPEGVREVSRELLPAILRGLEEVGKTVSSSVTAEQSHGIGSPAAAKLSEPLAEQVTTLFLQHDVLAATVRDFYANVGQVVARYDLNPEEILGFRGLLVEYIQLVVEDVLRHTEPIARLLRQLEGALPEVLRLLAPTADLGVSVERSPGRIASDWRDLTDWFVERPGHVSQVGALREATAKAIGSLLANVKRATSGGGISPGRRAELLVLARRFDNSTPTEADRLYAEALGLSPARHWLLIPDTDQTLPTTPWQDGTRTTVPVSITGRGQRAGRGRAASIMENPLGEQAAVAEAEERTRQLQAAYAELRAAAASLDKVTLSTSAFQVFYDLLRRAMSHRDDIDSTGEFVHAPSGLRLQVGHHPEGRYRVRSAHGILTLHDISISLVTIGGRSSAVGTNV